MSDASGQSSEQETELAELARMAADRWGFGPEAEIELFKHRENAVFRVTDGGERFAMRIHRRGYHTDAELESELAWIAALRADGFPTPGVTPAADGQRTARVGLPSVPQKHQVDVLEWFDGTPLGAAESEALTDTDDVTATFGAIGELMATAHNHAQSWSRPESFTRHAWDADGLLGPDPFWGPYWELDVLTDQQRALLQRAKASALDDLAAFGDGPDRYGLIHADFLPDNLLRGQDGLCLIDFDDAGFGWHLFDIATSLFPSQIEEWFEDAKAALIEGYRRRRALPDDHLERLPLFFFLRATTYLGWAHTRPESETAAIIGALVAAGIDGLIDDYLGSE